VKRGKRTGAEGERGSSVWNAVKFLKKITSTFATGKKRNSKKKRKDTEVLGRGHKRKQMDYPSKAFISKIASSLWRTGARWGKMGGAEVGKNQTQKTKERNRSDAANIPSKINVPLNGQRQRSGGREGNSG